MSRCSITIAALLGMIAFSASGVSAQDQTVWKFDNLSHIGGMTPKVEGNPQLVDSPVGKALQFNGKDTGLFTPQSSIKLPVGKHRVTLVNEEQNITKSFRVEITADSTTKLKAIPLQ